MLVHHSSQDYEEAAMEAASSAREKFDVILSQGRSSAEHLIDTVNTRIPEDFLVTKRSIKFNPEVVQVESDGIPMQSRVIVSAGNGSGFEGYRLHRNALLQSAVSAGLNESYVKDLDDGTPWKTELLAQTLQEFHDHSDDQRHLLRCVKNGHGPEVRGWLSSRYRRIDSRPLLDTFISCCQSVHALPFQGYITDTGIMLKAVVNQIFEPIKNEPIIFGVAWSNSDFGKGANSLSAFIMRLWCTNKAISENALRQVHLGGDLPENILWSNETYRLDTERSASIMADTVQGLLAPESIDMVLNRVSSANEKHITAEEFEKMLKKRLLKHEAKHVIDTFNTADIEKLPPGQTYWRASNAISWVAGQTQDTERSIDLMRFAGELLN